MPYRLIDSEIRINSEFNEKNIGGSLISPFFYKNPQYILSNLNDCDFQIQLIGPDVPLMLMLIKLEDFPNNFDLKQLSYYSIIQNINPGFYFEGFSHLESPLNRGNYLIVISTNKGELVIFIYNFL